MPELLTIHDVATRLQCSADCVRKLCLRGELAAVAISGTVRRRWRVPQDSLDDYLRRRTLRSVAQQIATTRARHRAVPRVF
jgi:excisionase family DNA binding protein